MMAGSDYGQSRHQPSLTADAL